MQSNAASNIVVLYCTREKRVNNEVMLRRQGTVLTNAYLDYNFFTEGNKAGTSLQHLRINIMGNCFFFYQCVLSAIKMGKRGRMV